MSKTTYLADYTPPPFAIPSIRLHFELADDTTRVRSRIAVQRNGDHQLPLVLDGEELELLHIAIDGAVLSAGEYDYSDGRLSVPTSARDFELETEVAIHPERNTSLSGLYKSSGNYCTQCEAEGFRRITFFPDRPDVLSLYETTITADRVSYPVLLSNGNPGETSLLEDGRHRITWTDPFPKPSYLFALVAGDLAMLDDRFVTQSGRDVDLQLYTQHHNIDRCAHAMASLKKAMRWDEEVYGREYDLDLYMIVAVDDFNMGAMENKGLNVFNSKYVLASPETATDADYSAIEGVIAHEYFHNWSGNRVTCRDWFQLSLKEGFTVFRDQEFSADMGSRGVQRIGDARVIRDRQFLEDAGPMAHPVRPQSYEEINNFYTVTVYNKGAEVVRMLHHLLGADRFRAGTDLYFDRFDGQAVTTDDFVACMEEVSGLDLSQFKRWYDQAGTPELSVTGRHDPEAATYTLEVAQSCPPTPGQPHKEPFHIPLRVALLDASGQLLDCDPAGATDTVLEITRQEQSFVFEDMPEAPVVSVLRGFSAPVKVEMGYGQEELELLIEHDDDPFARWEAAQRLYTNVLLGIIRKLTAGERMSLDDHRLAVFGRLLDGDGFDPALVAELLRLPSEDYLSEHMEVVDPEAVYLARRFVHERMAASLSEPLTRIYDSFRLDSYQIDAASMGRRSLRNTCLAMLAISGSEEAIGRVLDHFESAGNMTDSIAALASINDLQTETRQQLLDTFYTRWRDDGLVVDKWLRIQATSRLPDTLDRVMALTGHEAFNARNPNRVYSLLGAFAHGNPARFHDLNGHGYRFMAKQIIALDAANPQVAARLTSAFNNWRRFDAVRQRHARSALEEIQGTGVLSPDVREIVSKALK